MRYFLLALFALFVSASTTDRQITADQRAQFWRAQAEYSAAQVNLLTAQAKLKAISESIAEKCGADITFVNGELACSNLKTGPDAK